VTCLPPGSPQGNVTSTDGNACSCARVAATTPGDRGTRRFATFGRSKYQCPIYYADLTLHVQGEAVLIDIVEGQTEDLSLP
jgi:hypothetical protein